MPSHLIYHSAMAFTFYKVWTLKSRLLYKNKRIAVTLLKFESYNWTEILWKPLDCQLWISDLTLDLLKSLCEKSWSQQVYVLPDSTAHVMLTCQSSYRGENKCTDVKQLEFIALSLFPFTHKANSRFHNPTGTHGDFLHGHSMARSQRNIIPVIFWRQGSLRKKKSEEI